MTLWQIFYQCGRLDLFREDILLMEKVSGYFLDDRLVPLSLEAMTTLQPFHQALLESGSESQLLFCNAWKWVHIYAANAIEKFIFEPPKVEPLLHKCDTELDCTDWIQTTVDTDTGTLTVLLSPC